MSPRYHAMDTQWFINASPQAQQTIVDLRIANIKQSIRKTKRTLMALQDSAEKLILEQSETIDDTARGEAEPQGKLQNQLKQLDERIQAVTGVLSRLFECEHVLLERLHQSKRGISF
ncbi:hypothetical protein IWQ60_009487 [Tieghemiomyces parasiticus]|uniref:Uncharacterized protein n=1 Tax=Tieghemiomyces parasiticus TaxID=78921 RepID=A0A9W7ZMU8_9FUNG|nr:hypothetical protein IWQ60_009487 [Tieghemiomyces parasiticus]